jgi:hypothetical protein
VRLTFGQAVWLKFYLEWAYYSQLWEIVFPGLTFLQAAKLLERYQAKKSVWSQNLKASRKNFTKPKKPHRNYHHTTPRSRGGKDDGSNMMLIGTERHVAWHRLFKDNQGRDMTLEEIIRLLYQLDGCVRARGLRPVFLDKKAQNRP